MAEHTVNPKVQQDGIHPDCPAPTPQQQEPCEGEIMGTISGKLIYECCCDRLYTRTFAIKVGPQTDDQVVATIQSTVSAWEANGYLVLAHSITDLGGSWLVGITVGWYS